MKIFTLRPDTVTHTELQCDSFRYAELSRLSGMGAGDPGALKGAIDRCKNELQRDPDNEALAAVLKGMNDFAAYYAAESRFLTRIKETYEEALRKYEGKHFSLHLIWFIRIELLRGAPQVLFPLITVLEYI